MIVECTWEIKAICTSTLRNLLSFAIKLPNVAKKSFPYYQYKSVDICKALNEFWIANCNNQWSTLIPLASWVPLGTSSISSNLGGLVERKCQRQKPQTMCDMDLHVMQIYINSLLMNELMVQNFVITMHFQQDPMIFRATLPSVLLMSPSALN